jgi:aspartate/methionine/tyrosine aminotransferase
MAELSASALRVQHSRIRELAEIAMNMDGVLKLYFGESNIPTPEFIKRAAHKAMADGFTFYTSNAGLPSTRDALARYYEELHGVKVDPSRQIVVTASGVQALNVAIRCMLDPGDEAIVLTPAWPNGSAIVEMCNATPVQVPHVLRGERYSVDFDALDAAVTPRTRLLLYTSPSNPLGWVATDEEQTRILEFARKHNLWLLADEVYERLNYPDAPPAPAPSLVQKLTGRAPEAPEPPYYPTPTILKKATPEDAIVVAQSFSKAWCMTGWRVGWIVARPDLAARATQLNEFIISHAPTFAQRAGETALLWGEKTVLDTVRQYRHNRDYCMAHLSRMPGLTVPKPEGAFYLFPRVAGLTDSFAFCKDLLLETQVGLAPGVAFGAGGEGSVRICYASERSILEPAMQRLGNFLAERAASSVASGRS